MNNKNPPIETSIVIPRVESNAIDLPWLLWDQPPIGLAEATIVVRNIIPIICEIIANCFLSFFIFNLIDGKCIKHHRN